MQKEKKNQGFPKQDQIGGIREADRECKQHQAAEIEDHHGGKDTIALSFTGNWLHCNTIRTRRVCK